MGESYPQDHRLIDGYTKKSFLPWAGTSHWRIPGKKKDFTCLLDSSWVPAPLGNTSWASPILRISCRYHNDSDFETATAISCLENIISYSSFCAPFHPIYRGSCQCLQSPRIPWLCLSLTLTYDYWVERRGQSTSHLVPFLEHPHWHWSHVFLAWAPTLKGSDLCPVFTLYFFSSMATGALQCYSYVGASTPLFCSCERVRSLCLVFAWQGFTRTICSELLPAAICLQKLKPLWCMVSGFLFNNVFL